MLCFSICFVAIIAKPSESSAGWGTAKPLELLDFDAEAPHIAQNAGGEGFAVWTQPNVNFTGVHARRYVPGFGWTDPKIISWDSGTAVNPRVAVDRNGNAIAVWWQRVAMGDFLYASRYVPGSGWGPPGVISGNAVDISQEIAMDADGNALVVWCRYDGVWATRYAASGGWGPPVPVSSSSTGRPEKLQIAVDGGGNATAVWRQQTLDGYGYRWRIWASQYAGGGWSMPILIDGELAGDATDPTVAVDLNGSAMAAWQHAGETGPRIWANRCPQGSGWGTAALLEVAVGTSVGGPQLVADGSDAVLAVWIGDGILRASRFTAGGGWGAAVPIEDGGAGYSYQPQLAVDGGGSTIVVWGRDDGLKGHIWANRHDAIGGWGTAVPVESSDSASSRQPRVAADGDGNAIVVWLHSDGRANVWTNRHVAGSPWNEAVPIETDLVEDARSPRVAVDAGGNAVAIWQQSGGGLWANRYGARTGWHTAVRIDDYDSGVMSYEVAVNAGGDAVAVWAQYDPVLRVYDIWANRFSEGNWGAAAKLESAAGSAGEAQVALDSLGNAVAVWHQQQTPGSAIDNVWASRSVAGGPWEPPVLLENGSGAARYPQVVLDGNGNAIAVWQQNSGSRNRIFSRRSDAEGVWGTVAEISAGEGNAYGPRIALDGSGNAVTVWYQSHVGSDIWANRCPSGGSWGAPALIESDNAGSAVHPQLAVNRNGDAMAVWRRYYGNWYSVLSNYYTPGDGWGSQVPAEGLPEDADGLRVAIEDEGHAAVLFTVGYEVYVNRYAPGVGWATATPIESDGSVKAFPALASSGDGVAVGLWSRIDPASGRYDVWAKVFDISLPRSSVSLHGGAFQTPQTVTLACADRGSGCSRIYYTTNGSTPTIDSRIYTGPLTLAATTTLKYFATDKSGNSEPVHTEAYYIDAVPAQTTANPPGGLYKTGQFVTLTCDDGAGGGCGQTLFCLGEGCTPSVPFSAYGGYPIEIPVTSTLRFHSTDAAGNAEPVREQVYTIDTARPETAILSELAPANPTNASSATLVFEANEPGTFECRLDAPNDETPFSPCVAPTRYSSLADGIHTFQVRATDLAGNQDGTPATYAWRIDTQHPATSATPAGGTFTTLRSVTLSCDDGSGVGCASSPVQPLYCLGEGCTPSIPYAAPIQLPADAVLRYRSMDAVGNLEPVREEVYSYVQAGAELTLTLSHPAILQGEPLAWAAGQLSRVPDNGMELGGLTVTLTVTDPYGRHTVLEAVTNGFGQYRFEDIDADPGDAVHGFNLKGTYSLRARFGGNGVLVAKESGARKLLVGQSAGYAVIVEGRISGSEGLASHNKTANRVRRTLLERGFVEENIRYFNYDTAQEGVDAVPGKAVIREAIEQWALLRMLGAPAPLYVVLVDHGSVEAFHIDDGDAQAEEEDRVTPAELGGWLGALEAGLAANNANALAEKRVVIVGACYSGSFVPALAGPGRVVITSATAEEESYKGTVDPADGVRSGEFFLDELFLELGRGRTLRESFAAAAERTARYTQRGGANGSGAGGDGAVQHPLLEDDGAAPLGTNALSEGAGDGVASAEITLGVGLTNAAVQPAELVRVTPTQQLGADAGAVTLWASAREDAAVDHAWIEVRNLAEELTGQGGSGQLTPRTTLHLLEWDGERYAARFDAASQPHGFAAVFPEAGAYEVYYFSQQKQTLEVTSMKRSVVYREKAGNRPPGAPALLSPADDPGGQAPVDGVLMLDWEEGADPDGDAVSYRVVVSASAEAGRADYACNPGADICREELSASHLELDAGAGLQPGTAYRWKVVAVDGYGAATPSAGAWSFTTKNTNPELPGFVKGCVSNAVLAGVGVVSPRVSASRGSPLVSGSCYSLLASPGPVTISVTAAGYLPGSVSATVSPGVMTARNVALTPVQHELKVQTGGDGSGTVSGGGRYYHGSVRRVTAAALAGSVFAGWTGDCTGTAARVDVLVDRDKTCTAGFKLIPPGNRPPVLEPVGARQTYETEELSFRLVAADPDGDAVRYTAVGMPAGAALNEGTGEFRWRPAHDQAGSYPVTFRASDGWEADAETVTITVREQVVFFDDFANGTAAGDPDWRVLLGAWGVTGTAKSYASDARKAVNLALARRVAGTYKAGVVGFKGYLQRPAQGSANAALLFGYRRPSQYRYVELLPGKVAIGQVGALGGEGTRRKEFAAPSVRAGRWLGVAVTLAADGTVSVRVGTRLVASHRFGSPVAGALGLRAKAARSLVDNFTVRNASALR